MHYSAAWLYSYKHLHVQHILSFSIVTWVRNPDILRLHEQLLAPNSERGRVSKDPAFHCQCLLSESKTYVSMFQCMVDKETTPYKNVTKQSAFVCKLIKYVQFPHELTSTLTLTGPVCYLLRIHLPLYLRANFIYLRSNYNNNHI